MLGAIQPHVRQNLYRRLRLPLGFRFRGLVYPEIEMTWVLSVSVAGSNSKAYAPYPGSRLEGHRISDLSTLRAHLYHEDSTFLFVATRVWYTVVKQSRGSRHRLDTMLIMGNTAVICGVCPRYRSLVKRPTCDARKCDGGSWGSTCVPMWHGRVSISNPQTSATLTETPLTNCTCTWSFGYNVARLVART